MMNLSIHRGAARLAMLVVPVVALAVIALAITLWDRSDKASAEIPRPGLDFSLAAALTADGANLCNTTGGPMTCTVPSGASFFLKLYLNDRGGVEYSGYDAIFNYGSLVRKAPAALTGAGLWTDCAFPAQFETPGSTLIGCSIGIGASPSSYTGLMSTLELTCGSAEATVSITHGSSDTGLDGEHAEGEGTMESLTVTCGGGGGPSPTSVPPTATQPAGTPPTATNTVPVQPTATRTPTRTPTNTPTRTPTLPVVPGDIDKDGEVTSADAQLVLQYEAGVRSTIANLEDADLNGDDEVNSIDALFMLWIDAGMI
jgi:hypothetical protein